MPQPLNIYLASSWDNLAQVQETTKLLRAHAHQVYDFTEQGRSAGPHWPKKGEAVPYGQLAQLYQLPDPTMTFTRDMQALDRATALVCILPCGRSAHLELGYAIARGIITVILTPPTQGGHEREATEAIHAGPETDEGREPELMHRAADALCSNSAHLPNLLDLLAARVYPPPGYKLSPDPNHEGRSVREERRPAPVAPRNLRVYEPLHVHPGVHPKLAGN